MSENSAAIAFYVSLAAVLVGWLIVALKRSPYTPVQSLFAFLNVLLTRILWRASVPHRLPIGPDQGALLIPNHTSSIDPFFIQLAAGRVVHWMVTRESYEAPSSGWFMRLTEAIPVSRKGVDIAATKTALRYARKGGLVGIFPEGRINTSEKLMMQMRPGAALIALKAKVPLLPCYIEGAPYGGTLWSPFLIPAKVRVLFGDPIDLCEFYGSEREPEVLEEVMRRCVKAIARLAGDEEFEPDFAGRNWVPDEEQEKSGDLPPPRRAT